MASLGKVPGVGGEAVIELTDQYTARLWALYAAAGCTLEEAAAAINLWRKL